MASNKNSVCVPCTKVVARFSVQDGNYTVYVDVPQDGCRLALSGYNNNTKDTFIDLFALEKDPGFQDLSSLMTSQPYFSKEFTKMEGLTWRLRRFVCLLDDSVFVTCCFNTIESYDTKHGRIVNQRQFTGEARCMTTTRDGRIYVGLYLSTNVIVFDRRLNQINKIKLKGLQRDWPEDMIVNNNKLFIITFPNWRALMYNINGGVIEYEFKAPNQQYRQAMSITASKENGLIYILWGNRGRGKRVVVVYSFPGDHSSLPVGHSSLHEGHPSLSGCHFLASFNVSEDSLKTRVNKNVNRLFVVTCRTGEVYEYHTNDIINHENLLTLIALLITKDDCQKLLRYFKVSAAKAKAIQNSDGPSHSFLEHLIETGKISSVDISVLLTACKDKQIIQVAEAWTNYQKYLSYQKQLPTFQLEKSENQRKELDEKLTESENDRQELSDRLKETQLQKEALAERLTVNEEERRQVTDKLRESENERVQLKNRLEKLEEERQEVKEKRLDVTDFEWWQLTEISEVTEREKEQLTTRLAKLNGRLETMEKERKQLEERLKATEEEKEQFVTRLSTTEIEMQQLNDRQETTDEAKRLKRQLEENQQELEETKSSLRAAKNELIRAQVEYTKESIALQEVLQQTRETKHVTTSTASEEEQTLKENETSEVSHELAVLAADYGRLMVDVAEDLTLDNTLKLAFLYQLPNSQKDMLRRISLIETPGITLINFLKTRNIINMYDVTNLKKGLMCLRLYSTNAQYVVPYQQKVDPLLFEENRSPHIVNWPDEEIEALQICEISPQKSVRTEDSEEPQCNSDEERSTENIGRERKGRHGRDSPTMDILHMYIEHKINDEGGTITLMGVCFSIPEKALAGDHVIALTMIRDPDILLPGNSQRGRMTPLIKIEPEGLKLNKPARLIIPHSAIIPEPDRHSVIIFTGQPAQRESQKGHITWREENSVNWKLEQKTISLDINTLSYVFINLVSQEMEQKHVFRVVPFIDGILHANDDVFITVCFCKDNDAEYKSLLDDYKTKLTLGNYMTFPVTRTFTEGKDRVSFLGLTMSSQIGTYCLTEGEGAKLVDVDHLCAASRVSLQFRLHRSKDREDEMIDLKLEVSQGENNKMALILQSKIKNILLSRKSQSLLKQEIPKDLHRYENLKQIISGLLEKKHCEKLATFFELTPAEIDTVLRDSKPGMELMKILDGRELILPDKVFRLYQGLQASHLERIGRHVLRYIDESQKEKVNDSKRVQEDKKEASKKQDRRENVFKLTSNATRLIDEGYNRLDVQRALKLSHGKLDLGRRILVLVKDEHERIPLLPGSYVYKEQYIDEFGGDLVIAGIHLLVPAGALYTGRIVSISISTEAGFKGPISSRSMSLSPLVKFGPENLDIHKPVIMTIPHCAYITSLRKQIALDVYSGIPQKDKTIQWKPERSYASCCMSNDYLQVEIRRPCGLLGAHVPYQQNMEKHIRVIPIINTTTSSTDELSVSLLFYNDYKLGYDSIIHEEVYNKKGIVLHDPVSFQLKTMGSTLPVRISSITAQCNIHPQRLEVEVNSLWLLDRHSVRFRLQTKESTENITFDIESRNNVTGKILFQLSIWLKVDDMHRFDQTMSPFQQVLPKRTIESFKDLLNRIPDNLDEEQSIQLAKIFHLGDEAISRNDAHRKPGILLMEMLTKKYLLSAANVSRFEYALTEIGNERCAKLVRDFRRTNPVVQATIFPGND